MQELKFFRGEPVMIDPNISGPAAGQSGFISGNMKASHFEVLDRHPRFTNAQTIGWFECDQLTKLRRRKEGRR
ncbi:MAG: hypothetical protein ACOY94_19715 [Bacillota bacterium]